jgi:hypothetical protein
MAAFSFAYNPFVVLPVSLRAGPRDVEESFQRRLAARPQDEAALTRARRLLLEPDSRLAAELSWLIDVGPREAVTLLGAMAGGNEAALLDALASQPALSKANVSADACARLKSTAYLRPLALAHRALDPAALTRLINEIHAAIPIPPASPRLVEAALRAVTMLHAGAALEAISAQADRATALANATVGPDAASGALAEEILAQYWRRYPPPAPEAVGAEEPAPLVEAAAAIPATSEAFAEVHAVGEHSWGEGAAGAAAAANAFMDAQLIFSAHDRFDTWGNSRRVRRVLYVMGGALAAAVLLILVVTRPKDVDDASNNAVDPPAVNYTAAAPPPPTATGRGRHKVVQECIHVSGAVYCTNS